MYPGFLLAGIENGVIDLEFQGHLTNSNQDSNERHSVSLV